jgi:ABC-2 type transport system ATP-binding protein/lipopolysaccharide transport system ATP-binding protein
LVILANNEGQTSDGARIRLQGVSLCYRLARQRYHSFKEYAINLMRGSLAYRELWALDGVDLEVDAGEILGIVGRNGAGKSTLLKVVCRILKPTRGQVSVQGRIAPLLELGTGFDHELTGFENLYLNALLLGHTRQEIDKKADDIVLFSELGDFIHSPIRNYSSGMVGRLAFSIATAWKPEILIVDEVLGVGDAAFMAKCEERLQRLHEGGTTVLMVSHNATAVRRNCSRCVWLDSGKVVVTGPADEVLEQYGEKMASLAGEAPKSASDKADG